MAGRRPEIYRQLSEIMVRCQIRSEGGTNVPDSIRTEPGLSLRLTASMEAEKMDKIPVDVK